MSKNHIFHQKSKDIYIGYNFLKELIYMGEFHVMYFKLIDQFYGIFKNPLKKYIFEIHGENLDIVKFEAVRCRN